MNAINIEAQTRNIKGKKASLTERKQEAIPCVLYGAGTNISFTATIKSLRSLIYKPEFQVAGITIDGNTYQAIVKEYQSHPLTDEITHVDFLLLEEGKLVNVELPLKLSGIPRGVRDGGKLTQKLRKLKVRTTPEKLVSMLDVNVEHIELGKVLRVGDLNIPGIEFLHSANIPLASVFIPRVIREEVPVAAAAAAAPGAAPAAGAAAPAAGAAAPAGGKAPAAAPGAPAPAATKPAAPKK
jgi:large subunit ribosomal protein L25